jgi:hypothetical protein
MARIKKTGTGKCTVSCEGVLDKKLKLTTSFTQALAHTTQNVNENIQNIKAKKFLIYKRLGDEKMARPAGNNSLLEPRWPRWG